MRWLPEKRWTGCCPVNLVLRANLFKGEGCRLKLLIVENENQVVFSKESIANFSIVNTDEREHAWMEREPSLVQPILRWQTEQVAPTA